jgi:hypothetical protein
MVLFMLLSRRRRTKYQVVLNLADYASGDEGMSGLLLLDADNPKHRPLLEANEWDRPMMSYGAVPALPLRSIEVYAG